MITEMPKVDDWTLVEQAFWDGTFDAPLSRRGFLRGAAGLASSAATGLAGGGLAALGTSKPKPANKSLRSRATGATEYRYASPQQREGHKFLHANLERGEHPNTLLRQRTAGARWSDPRLDAPGSANQKWTIRQGRAPKPSKTDVARSKRLFGGGDAVDAPFIGSSRAGQHLGAALRGAGRGAGRAVRRGGGIGGNVGEKIGQRIGRSSYGSKGAKVGGNVGGGIGAAAGGLLDRLGGKKGAPGAKLLGGIGQHYGGKLGRSVASQYGAARGGEKGRGIGGLVGRLAGAAISPVGAARGARQGLERSKAHAGAVRKIGTQAVGRALQGGGGRQIGGGGAQRMLPGRPTGRGTRALPGAR